MTTTLLGLLPALICIGMMFGAGAAIRIATRPPLRRVPWIARRIERRGDRTGHSLARLRPSP